MICQNKSIPYQIITLNQTTNLLEMQEKEKYIK
jgi:hypothetical protein